MKKVERKGMGKGDKRDQREEGWRDDGKKWHWGRFVIIVEHV